jgi:TetR/AcrR family transcriptional repressor of nem operon
LERFRLARPREFDEAAVLGAAIQCFWANGYEATSVRDLASEMGITSASIYNAFGDKRGLYRRALDHYIEESLGERAHRLEKTHPPRELIGAFFEEIIECSLEDQQRKGCMLVNSALELAPHDREAQKVVAGVLVEGENFFRRLIQAGQKDGTIATSQPADDLARLLLGVLLGIRVLARVRPERELLEGLARPVLALLDCNLVA